MEKEMILVMQERGVKMSNAKIIIEVAET